ncbi:transcriptional regulator, GntR family [Tistlia consotensis]|uniref:Transcriptional regulator, GntR family n=1 Tax=Tistlia consotensis USBA 355 TaxID=560819 RepID=A0A1Y6BJX1_9PROT|nr:PLP-dependent aminotransferase family protein [Tistlia consotensis]SMF13469.1 transcriptional regulator, GntR family [Tistlia consotensis USBA 355]SNR50469.1 transcriptional regulator, GntR family [Tistlia consotensis]
MQSWLPFLAEEPGPKYLAIADAIERAVRSGVLRPGERLPSQRELARRLAVDLTTVTRAIGLLRDAGWVEGAGRLGTYVRNDAGALARLDDGAAESGMNMPPQPGFALLEEAIRTGTAKLLRVGGQSPLLQYQPNGGNLHDRAEAAARFSGRGVATSEDEVVIAAGGQNALHAILAGIARPGDVLYAGRHVYPGLLALAARFSLAVVPVEGDGEGLDPDALEAAIVPAARALYIVPTNDNPTTATTTLERRRAIAAVARRHGLAIVEDDAYGQLPSAPLPCLARLAPELTWHIASLSKIVSPVLRVAHVRAPSAQQAWRLAADVQETAVMAPPLNAALVTGWMRDGTLEQLVAAIRAEAVARQRIVARHLPGADYAAHPEGYHLWLPLRDGAGAAELVAAVRPLGLSIVSGSAFAVRSGDPLEAVRISIGGALDHDRLRRAIERVAAILGGGASRRGGFV